MSGAGGFEEQSGPGGLLHWPHNKPTRPFVAICSPVDGAISEETALVPADTVARSIKRAPRENVRIRCSHFGMAYNPFVFLAVADRPRAHHINCCPDRFRFNNPSLSQKIPG